MLLITALNDNNRNYDILTAQREKEGRSSKIFQILLRNDWNDSRKMIMEGELYQMVKSGEQRYGKIAILQK